MIKKTRMNRIYITGVMTVSVLGCFLFTGCSGNNAETIKEILVEDPSFQKALDERNDIHKKLSAAKTEYDKKQADLEKEITVIQGKKAGIKVEYLSTVSQVRKKLDSEKRRLRQELADKEEQLKMKNLEMADIDRDANEIDALVKKKDRLELTGEEMKVWNKRLLALARRRVDTGKEIAGLNKKIHIIKLEIKVLDAG